MSVKFNYGNAAQELNQVHSLMIAAYDQRGYESDIKKAKKMEEILRKLKTINITQTKNENNLESIFDEQCFEIANDALKKIQIVSGSDNLYAKKLFITTHSKGYELSNQMNIDDIVEAEIASVIQSIRSLAFSEDINMNNIDIFSNTTGRIKGNLSQEAQKFMENVTEGVMKQTIDKITNTNFRNKPYQKIAAKLKDTQAKSIKADVISFEAELSAKLKPEWEQFSVFSGASFTIKNYMSKRKGGVAIKIHLGETNPYKSVMAQLSYLGYSFKQSQHIFFHSLNSWMKNKTKAVEIHIPHLRFSYELEGNGLYDENGVSISGANFLIINDPISENIYVRSTKALIANALKNSLQSSEPFTSSQYILYDDLINNKI